MTSHLISDARQAKQTHEDAVLYRSTELADVLDRILDSTVPDDQASGSSIDEVLDAHEDRGTRARSFTFVLVEQDQG